MTKYLGQAHEVILVVRQKLVGHCVPQQMRMELEAANRTVLVAQIPHSTVSQFATLTDEDIWRSNRGPSFQPRLK